eukprot:5497867-Prymnesium_polylepis.1
MADSIGDSGSGDRGDIASGEHVATGSLLSSFDLDAVSASSIALAAVGLLGIACVAALLERVVTAAPTRQDRFVRYLAFFDERHAEWCGNAPDLTKRDRVIRHLTSEHSLVRLFFPPPWWPIPLFSRASATQTLIALLLVRMAVAAVFWSPSLGFSGGSMATLMAMGACSGVHMLLRLVLDRIFALHAIRLSRLPPNPRKQGRPTAGAPGNNGTCGPARGGSGGAVVSPTSSPSAVGLPLGLTAPRGMTEGHVVARAALTHFDATHTLQRVLWLWQRNAWYLKDVRGVLARCRAISTLRHWREVTELILAEEAAYRLREQKLRSWSLMRPGCAHAHDLKPASDMPRAR